MKVLGKRALLNPPGVQSLAAVVAEIEDTSSWKDGRGREGKKLKEKWEAVPLVTLRISDCDRSITLSTDWSTKAERAATAHKLDMLIDALTSFRSGLRAEQQRYVSRSKGLK